MGNLFRKNLAYLRPYHWVLEALSALLGLAAVVVALVGRSKLPEEVPTHWDFHPRHRTRYGAEPISRWHWATPLYS